VNKPLNTDTALLEGLATGNREAVAEIYRLYRPMLIKWIITRGGTEIDADDIFQEALMVMFEKAKLPEFCLTCKLSTYLFAISKRLWFKKIEYSSGYIGFNEEEEEEESAAHAYEDDLLMHLEKEHQFVQLWQSMEKLGEPCSQLLKAFYIDAKSMQQIAADFSYTNAENAKTQKYKCLTRLKKIFFDARTVAGPK
jgi:RNA polymerase sigma factor (sigma-70 family)